MNRKRQSYRSHFFFSEPFKLGRLDRTLTDHRVERMNPTHPRTPNLDIKETPRSIFDRAWRRLPRNIDISRDSLATVPRTKTGEVGLIGIRNRDVDFTVRSLGLF